MQQKLTTASPRNGQEETRSEILNTVAQVRTSVGTPTGDIESYVLCCFLASTDTYLFQAFRSRGKTYRAIHFDSVPPTMSYDIPQVRIFLGYRNTKRVPIESLLYNRSRQPWSTSSVGGSPFCLIRSRTTWQHVPVQFSQGTF